MAYSMRDGIRGFPAIFGGLGADTRIGRMEARPAGENAI
jgi:hypothetical protein